MATNWKEYLDENVGDNTAEWKRYLAKTLPPAQAGQFDPQPEVTAASSMYNPSYRDDTGTTWDNVRDVAAGLAKIPTTAAKGVADVSALLTNDLVGRDASNFFGKVNEDIDNTLGSERLRQSKAAFNAVMNDPSKNIGDMLGQIIDSPRIAVDQGITQLGTMLPITGTAKLTELGLKAAKYGPEAIKMGVNAATIGSNALLNAADTFGDESMQQATTLDRYAGAGVSALMSLMSGIVTEGGAEGQIARRLMGDIQKSKPGALNAAKAFLKSVSKEGGQEIWEEGGNVAGNYVGTNEVPNFNNAAKQMGFAGMLGGLMGGATHVATQSAVYHPSQQNHDLEQVLSELLRQQNKQQAQASQAIPETNHSKTDLDKTGESVFDNPIDVIIENGGIRREVLTKDLGWTDEEISKLPEGVVSDDGMELLPTKRILKKAGLDTDVNAILDAASRPETPEMDFAEAESELLSQPQENQPLSEPAVDSRPKRERPSPLESETTWEQQRDAEIDRAAQTYEKLNGLSEKQLRGRLKTIKGGTSDAVIAEIGMIKEMLAEKQSRQKSALAVPDALNRPPITRESFGLREKPVPVSEPGKVWDSAPDHVLSQFAREAQIHDRFVKVRWDKLPDRVKSRLSDVIGSAPVMYPVEANKEPVRFSRKVSENDVSKHETHPVESERKQRAIEQGYLTEDRWNEILANVRGTEAALGGAQEESGRGNQAGRVYDVSLPIGEGIQDTGRIQGTNTGALSGRGTGIDESSRSGIRLREEGATGESVLETGRGLQTFYHGTRDDIHGFELDHPNRKDHGWLGEGIYLTDSPDLAYDYADIKQGEAGKNILPLNARIDNPYLATPEEKERISRNPASGKTFTQSLKEQGYDSVVLDLGEGKHEIVVFDSSKIRSVNAQFDPEKMDSNNLLFSFIGKKGAGPTVESVQSAIENDPVNNIAHVVQSIEELPEQLKEQVKDSGAENDVEGIYDPNVNKVYLIADNLSSPERAVEVARHEVIGHYGMENMLGKERMAYEVKMVRGAIGRNNKAILELSREVKRSQPELSESDHAKEIIAMMAERNMQNGLVRRVLNAIRKFLKKIGLIDDATDAEIASMLRDARTYLLEQNRKMVGGKAAPAFSLSAMKAVEANIARGKEAMNRALLDKTSVHRAMFRNGLGWVDFVWGSTGRITDSGRTRGAMGISHILEARQRKDGLSESETIKLLHNIVEVIARGEESRRFESGYGVRVNVTDGNGVVSLVKLKGSNAFVVTGFRTNDQVETVRGATQSEPTQREPIRSRQTLGADRSSEHPETGRKNNIPQNDETIAFSRKKAGNPVNEKQLNTDVPVPEEAAARKTFDVPDITLGDVFVRSVQDDNYDLKKVIQAIREQGGIVTDKTDAYTSEEEYLGRTKNRLDKFTEGHALPIIEKIRESGVSLDEAGKYVLARHVMLDQVNAKLKAINPGSTSERLSGMSNREAREILDRNASNTALQELGRMMDALARYTRSVMLNGGLITKETHDHWADSYQHYVPLYRDLNGTRRLSAWERLKEADFKPWNIREAGQGNQEAGRRSRGFEVKGAESRHRMGSDLDVTNVIVNAVAQAEGAIIRSEKAKVALALLDLAKANPNDSFWQVDTPISEKQTNPETGLIEYVYRDANLKPADNVLVVKERGRERWIVFNEHNKRAMEIAKKFKNLDAAAMNWAVEGIGDLTRWMAGWLTQKNPIFMFFNFQRDLQHAVFNMADTPIAGKEGQFLKNVPLAMKGYWEITRSANKDAVNNTFANYAREFKEAGAETGFIKSFESVNDRITDIEEEIRKMSRGNTDPRTWLTIAGRAVDDYNAIAENGVRLAAYVTARENGMTIPRAASLAKNITVNFNKRGTSGRWLNALYMFANANIQGNARMLRALAKSRRARIYAGFMVGIGFVMDMVCSSILGDDDETGKPIWDEISEFDKERNWIVPISTKNYIKIPLPQGLHILPNAGRMLSELIRTGNTKNALESASRIVLMTADTLSPLGASGSWFQTVMPSVIRPFVQISENKSFTGSKLYRGDAPYGGYNEPAYTKAFRNTPKHWVNASKMLNFATGGDDVTPGKINVPPEALRLAFTSFVAPGISSQVVDRALDALVKAGEGNELKLRDLPVVSRVVGEMPDERVQEHAFFGRMDGLSQKVYQADEYRKTGRIEEMRNVLTELGDGSLSEGKRRARLFHQFRHDMSALNRERRRVETILQEHPERRLAADRLDKIKRERKRLIHTFDRAAER